MIKSYIQKINLMIKHRKIALDFSMPMTQNKGIGVAATFES